MATGPIDYSMPGVMAPGQAFLQAAQVGAGLSQAQLQRQMFVQQTTAAQQEADIKAAQQIELQRLQAIPLEQMTQPQRLRLAQLTGSEATRAYLFREAERIPAERQAGLARNYGSTIMALARNPQIGLQRLETLTEAEADPQQKKALQDLTEVAKTDPIAAVRWGVGLMEMGGGKFAEVGQALRKALSAELGEEQKPMVVGGSVFYPKTREFIQAPVAPAKPTPSETEELVTRLQDPNLPATSRKALEDRLKILTTRQAPLQVNMPGQPAVEKEEQKAKGTFNVEQYKGLVTTANVAARVLPALVTQEKLLAQGFQTGFGTQAKKVGASVLSALGVPEAESFAANAETFFAAMNNAVLQKQLDQKGPQTEADAQRITATGAQLGNTVRGNQFIIALAKAQLKRDVEKRRFWDNYWRTRKTYEGAEESWESGPGAAPIFEAPELKPFLDVAPAQARPAAPAAPASPAAPAGEGVFRIRNVRPSGG